MGAAVPATSESGLADTIEWYREHEAWWRPAKDGDRGQRTRKTGPVMDRADRRDHRRSRACWSYDLPVHGDARGWFKENWQREKMVALGLPDFGPVQNNVSFNAAPRRDPRASTPSRGTSSSR
ncbi:MAG: hypothetical protein V9G04_13540 [Nocardioides sp.]